MVRKSLDYRGIARRGFTDGYVDKDFVYYDRDIDVSAVVQDTKRRRFNVIDRAVEKARVEIKMQMEKDIPDEDLSDESEIILKDNTTRITLPIDKVIYSTRPELKMEDEEDLADEYPFYHHTIMIVSGANMAEEEDLKREINGLNEIIDTGYYDDDAGNELMKHVRNYLIGKLPEERK